MTKSSWPSYLELYESKELDERVERAKSLISPCRLCPHECGVDRVNGELGICATGSKAWVSSFSPHFGEERPLVGSGGSGTIFFTSCNLLCLFCQNEDISHGKLGRFVEAVELGGMMIRLQSSGCHNINFVTPTHQVFQILEALVIAVRAGLNLPIVYNTGGYDSVETLKILDGIVDIYMPDFKFMCKKTAEKITTARNYGERAKEAIKEMHRQVGDLVIEKGVAKRGLLVRHLVLPEGLADTRDIMRFLAKEISKDTYVNIMSQYYPSHRAWDFSPLDRRISMTEYLEATQIAREEGIWRFDK